MRFSFNSAVRAANGQTLQQMGAGGWVIRTQHVHVSAYEDPSEMCNAGRAVEEADHRRLRLAVPLTGADADGPVIERRALLFSPLSLSINVPVCACVFFVMPRTGTCATMCVCRSLKPEHKC